MSKNWCFTINNYAETAEEHLQALYPISVKYLIYGKEVASSTGTPHLQGYLQLIKGQRLSGVIKLLPKGTHVEQAKGTPDQASAYCRKEGKYQEYGQIIVQRQRTDLDAIKKAIREGMDLKTIREEHSETYAKYPRFVQEYMKDQIPSPVVAGHELRPWQAALNVKLNLPTNDREIIFLVDPHGNKGKTWFSKMYCNLHNNAQILESSKKADMAYTVRQDIRVLFISCTRTSCEYLPYGFLESVKDQLVFSAKYESTMKYMLPCHVVVMMNQEPDMYALSKDRYTIINL